MRIVVGEMRRVLILSALVAGAASAPAATTTLAPPVPGAIIRHFEPPPTPYAAGHRGVDLAAPVGAVVRAAASGIVTFAGSVAGELFVTVDHGDVRTTYSYLSSVLVKRGEAVATDQPIATAGVGHAGSATSHVHFSVRRGDEYLDPEPFMVAALRAQPWRVLRLVVAA